MKLIRCINCGNVIDGRSAFCQNCGSKISKPAGCGKLGCIAVLIAGGVFFVLCVITAILPPGDNTKNQETAKDDNKQENRSAGTKKQTKKAKQKSEENPPENSANSFQVDTFSNQGATLFVQNFLENRLRSIVNITLKFPSVAKIQKLSDVSPEIVEEFKHKQKASGVKIDPEKIYIVEQEFCDRDNQKERFSYYSLVEFAEGRGYRVLFLAVDGKQIFPAR